MAEACQATARSTGAPCRNPAVPGNRTCRMHGGHRKILRGDEHPQFKWGRRVVHLTEPMLDKWRAHRDNPERHRLETELALLRALADTYSEDHAQTLGTEPVQRHLVFLSDAITRTAKADAEITYKQDNLLTTEQILVYARRLTEIVRRYVTDPAALAEMQAEVAYLLAGPKARLLQLPEVLEG